MDNHILEHSDHAPKRRRLNPTETGPFVLRPVLEDIPLSTDDAESEAVAITCVEYWNSHLYIGTSASEILHFVTLPSDEDQDESGPAFILASRLQPSGRGTGQDSSLQAAGETSGERRRQLAGVQQILILPGPAKACVLCNGVVSFYSLPELSPAFPNKEPSGVQWIGGLDEDEGAGNPDGTVVMIANSKRILLVRVGEKLRPVKNNIEYPGCLRSSRRGTIACVADKSSYALLEVEYQQKIPLFPISSVSNVEESNVEASKDMDWSAIDKQGQSRLSLETQGHSRSTSLGTFMSTVGNRQRSPQAEDRGSRSLHPPDLSSQGSDRLPAVSPAAAARPRSATDAARSPQRSIPPTPTTWLKPHILSPSVSEFLLTTGSGKDDPGVGIFVNLDGDVVRGTVEFERYPDALSIDFAGRRSEIAYPSGQRAPDDTIFALMRRPSDGAQELGLETHTLSTDPTAMIASKGWLPISKLQPNDLSPAGLHFTLSACNYMFREVGHLLRLVRYTATGRSPPSPSTMVEPDPRTKAAVERVEEEKALFDQQVDETQLENGSARQKQRDVEELKFARSLGYANSQTMAWAGGDLWQVVANPEILQLESSLWSSDDSSQNLESLDLAKIASIFARIKDREAETETEFLSLNYIRQKASMMLYLHVLADKAALDGSLALTESTLLSGGIDPRLILLLLPGLRDEVQEGPQGIWIYQGLAEVLRSYSPSLQSIEAIPLDIWLMLRRLLGAWQDKRGYASITDEKLVFDSVDAALLLVLLHLDQSLPIGSGSQASTRAKLNNVVDHWKGNFDRAVALLEQYQRLFVLSRLYQSRKLSKSVLQTWKRIADGEPDIGGEMSSAGVETRVRQYLVNIRDASVVKDYGLWLAGRNPDLAIQLFTDDSCRVKFTPQEVTAMLKDHAPGAVQQYLEHLVFNKGFERYADDLIGYYLDSVLSVLESSEEARASLSESYSTYRALEKPKPTYLNFITENAPPETWWQSRLRLLQLLGSGSYATSESSKDLTYSIPKVLDRLAPFSSFLVSESIILDARQGRHKEALQLLTHGLGDYDTAVRYCYFGGPTAASSRPIDASLLPSREAQRDLFSHLFEEFLLIEDENERVERSSELLGKFAAWFDPLTVFTHLPESWTVDLIGDFLLRTLRSVTSEYSEALILKALSATQNLQRHAALVEACEKFGMRLEVEADHGSAGEVS